MKTRTSYSLTHKLFELILFHLLLDIILKWFHIYHLIGVGTYSLDGPMALLGFPEFHFKAYQNVPKPSHLRQPGYYGVT